MLNVSQTLLEFLLLRLRVGITCGTSFTTNLLHILDQLHAMTSIAESFLASYKHLRQFVYNIKPPQSQNALALKNPSKHFNHSRTEVKWLHVIKVIGFDFKGRL